MKSSWWRGAAPVLVGLALWALPCPETLAPHAWRYFALFAAVIVGLILEPLPAAAIGFLGVTLATALRCAGPSPSDSLQWNPRESLQWGLSGFSDTTVWLIFGAFMLSLGYQKTGLGRRLALLLVRSLGRRTLGLGYAIALADLLLAPGTPSNTARSAGTVYPLIRCIPELYGSEPGPTARKIGAYLMWTAFAATAVTSSMFLTSLAPNLLALSLVREATGLEVTWTQWLIGFLPMGVILLALLPATVYILYPPEIKQGQQVPAWAAQQLAQMGNFSRPELIMTLLVILALTLWIFGGAYFTATTVVLIVISLMIITRVIQWSDILGNTQAWNVFVWFATLVTLANGLNTVGFISWFAHGFTGLLSGLSPLWVMVLLVAFFFLIHYMFASLTAHTAALLPVLLAIGKNIPGLPMLPFALLLCYCLGLMGVLTPYATGPAPVYYASGYVSRGEFWRLGLIFGLIYLAVLLAVGIPYLTRIMA